MRFRLFFTALLLLSAPWLACSDDAPAVAATLDTFDDSDSTGGGDTTGPGDDTSAPPGPVIPPGQWFNGGSAVMVGKASTGAVIRLRGTLGVPWAPARSTGGATSLTPRPAPIVPAKEDR